MIFLQIVALAVHSKSAGFLRTEGEWHDDRPALRICQLI